MNESICLFFDVGSALIDETECYNHRIRDAITETDITFEQFPIPKLKVFLRLYRSTAAR